MNSLEISDAAAAAVAVAPRVTLADIEGAIVEQHFATGMQAVGTPAVPARPELATLTLCVLVLRNGFIVVGKSAPASPENFDADLGRKFAREDAIRQIWPLMGFALRDKLAGF